MLFRSLQSSCGGGPVEACLWEVDERTTDVTAPGFTAFATHDSASTSATDSSNATPESTDAAASTANTTGSRSHSRSTSGTTHTFCNPSRDPSSPRNNHNPTPSHPTHRPLPHQQIPKQPPPPNKLPTHHNPHAKAHRRRHRHGLRSRDRNLPIQIYTLPLQSRHRSHPGHDESRSRHKTPPSLQHLLARPHKPRPRIPSHLPLRPRRLLHPATLPLRPPILPILLIQTPPPHPTTIPPQQSLPSRKTIPHLPRRRGNHPGMGLQAKTFRPERSSDAGIYGHVICECGVLLIVLRQFGKVGTCTFERVSIKGGKEA